MPPPLALEMRASGLKPGGALHRFYLPPADCQTDLLVLTDQEAHHAIHVLRAQPGDRVTVLDGIGHEFLGEIEAVSRHSVSIRVAHRTESPRPNLRVTLFQGVSKARSMDTIVQKATELGVHQIVPVLSDRSVVHLRDETAERKVAKWQAVAVEALKQCGTPWLPRVTAVATPRQVVEQEPRFDLILVASLQPQARHPRACLEGFAQQAQRRPADLGVWVGPEGDFTPAELQLIQSAGAIPITLGPWVLRSETAALYCLAILNYELQA